MKTRNANEFQGLGTVHNRALIEDISLIDVEKRSIPFVIVSKDNAGLRYDWWEDEIYEERLDPNGAKFDELNTFFKDHRVSVDTAIGKVVNKRVDNGEIKVDVIFGTDEDAERVFNKYRDGILTDVSIGYSIQEVTTTERENQPTEVLVNRFNIHELSAVWKGFDTNAKIGRNKENLEKEVKPDEEVIESLSPSLREKRQKKLRLAKATMN